MMHLPTAPIGTAIAVLLSSALNPSAALAQPSTVFAAQPHMALTHIAQAEQDVPRVRRNRIGIGANIGLSGDETALGDGGFVILSRTGLNRLLSFRSTTIFGDPITSTFALAVEVPVRQSTQRIWVIPFVGGGALLTTEDGIDIDGFVTTGMDIPITRDLTGTVQVDVGFREDTDVGLVLGIGYNF